MGQSMQPTMSAWQDGGSRVEDRLYPRLISGRKRQHLCGPGLILPPDRFEAIRVPGPEIRLLAGIVGEVEQVFAFFVLEILPRSDPRRVEARDPPEQRPIV